MREAQPALSAPLQSARASAGKRAATRRRRPTPAASLPTNRQIERQANAMLDACVAAGRAIGPPVPVEWIAEHLLDLRILWDTLPSAGDAPVLGGLDPIRGEIVLNEAEARRFAAFPGLEVFTLAHEIGHWVLHVPPIQRRQLLLPGLGRTTGRPCGADGGAAPHREQEADRFAAYLLMPARLLLPRCERLDLTRFPARYKLRDEFGVSITAMNLRLKELGFGAFNERDEYIPGKVSAARPRERRMRPAPIFAAG